MGTPQDNGVIYTNLPYTSANLDSNVYYFSPLIIADIPQIKNNIGVTISGAGSELVISSNKLIFNKTAVEDRFGNIYLNHIHGGTAAGAIIKYNANTNTTGLFVGNQIFNGSTDGTTTNARFFALRDMVIDSNDNIFAVDQAGRCIRKITPAGVVTTFAGNASNPSNIYTDGIGTIARFPTYNRTRMAIDSDDNIYLVSAAENARTLRKITPAGTVSTLAGLAGQSGFQDGLGTSARFNLPTAVAIDSNKNIYVFDAGNHNLRKVTPAGEVTTFAGSSQGQTCMFTEENPTLCDGIGSEAKFFDPLCAIVDQFDNLYFGEVFAVRKVNLNTAEVTTIGGVPGGYSINYRVPVSGTGFNVPFDLLESMKLDPTQSGVILISDSQCIIKMKQGGFYSKQ